MEIYMVARPVTPKYMNADQDAFLFFQRRYKQAYSLARTTSLLGTLIQIGALILGAILIGVSLLAGIGSIAPNNIASGAGIIVVAVGCTSGVVVGGLFFLLGVVISTLAQIVLATLDTAVSCTPLLTQEQKRAMIDRRAQIR
jgi:Ca2+/Na+ antiporter